MHFTLCFQVTHKGISELAAKNPSIETLIMSNCYNISDYGVINAVKHLSRLKHLELEVCHFFDINKYRILLELIVT
jgi:hypothetical protein